MYDAMTESVFNSWKYYRLDIEIVLIDGQIEVITEFLQLMTKFKYIV